MSESIHVKMPHCWKSRAMAHLISSIICFPNVVTKLKMLSAAYDLRANFQLLKNKKIF